jgi:spore coat protein SA
MAFYRCWRRILSRAPWPAHRRFIETVFGSLLADLQPGDILWIHNRPEFAIALRKPVQQAGARIVLHLHNAHLVDGPEALMKKVQVDACVFVSKFLLKQAQKKLPSLGPATVIYNGADEAIFHPTLRKPLGHPLTVLFAGRLVREKGVHVLLEAMALLHRQGVPLRAWIVGSSGFGVGKETEYIRSLKITAPPTVTFLPYRSGMELGVLFREADLFCSPAVWEEPFGLVNVEALASGLPVVATRSGGTEEILAGGGGLLVDRGSATELAAALRLLTEDAGLRDRLGRQAHHVFRERFTWSRVRREVAQMQHDLRLRRPSTCS